MANQFVNLPAPAGNGAGAAVDVSTFGGLKTVVVKGSWPKGLTPPTINVEINNAVLSTDGSWAPACTSFRGTGVQTFVNAARWMRITVSALKPGQAAPVANVGGNDDGATFVNLPVPSGNGVGAPVNISALLEQKTLQIGGRFSGSIILELSEDAAGAKWAQWTAMQAPGQLSALATAYWGRIRRVGVPRIDPYGTPVVYLGATTGGGSGPSDGHRQTFAYVVTGLEPDLDNLVIALPAGRADASYQVQVTQSDETNFLGPSVPAASRTPTQFVLALTSDATANDIFWFTVEDPT